MRKIAYLISMLSLPLMGMEQKEQPEKPLMQAIKTTGTVAATAGGGLVGGAIGYKVCQEQAKNAYQLYTIHPVGGAILGAFIGGSLVYELLTRSNKVEKKNNEK